MKLATFRQERTTCGKRILQGAGRDPFGHIRGLRRGSAPAAHLARSGSACIPGGTKTEILAYLSGQ